MFIYSRRKLSKRACNAASSADRPSACGTLSAAGAAAAGCLIPVGASAN